MTALLVAAGAALGAPLRFVAGQWLDERLPWGTLLVNVVGSALLALLPSWGVVRAQPLLVALVGPGVLGGFTTLSTYSEDARALLADGHLAVAAAYLLGTLVACLLAVVVADRLRRRQEAG